MDQILKSGPEVILVHPAVEIDAVRYRYAYYIKCKFACHLIFVGKNKNGTPGGHLFVNR